MTQSSPTILLDARGLLIRDYSGTTYKSVATSDGTMVPAWEDGLASFLDRTLFPLFEMTPPRKIYAVFDDGNTFRRRYFPEYKQHRRARDKEDQTAEQKALLYPKAKRIMAYCGVRCVWAPGEEADDVIALLAKSIEGPIIVYTRDGDLVQLASHTTTVYQVVDPVRIYGIADALGLQQDLDGLPFDLIALKKSIIGDSSDGYKGVPGCGPKFFDTLKDSFGLDGLYELDRTVASNNVSRLQGTGSPLLDKLHAQFAAWRLSYFLAKLHPEACFGSYKDAPKRLQWYVRVPNKAKVREVLEEAKINMLGKLEAFDSYFPKEYLITAEMSEWLVNTMPSILASEIVSYDFETTDYLNHAPFRKAVPGYVDMLSSKLTGLSINWGPNLQYTIYLPCDHKDTNNFSQDWMRWVLESLNTRTGPTVVQNANFELAIAKNDLGIVMNPPFDTAIMASYADENEEAGLKDNSLEWFGYRQTTYAEVTKGRPMNELTGPEVLSYGCDDSLLTSHLFDVKRTILQAEGMWAFYASYEVDPAADDVSTFIHGTCVNLPRMAELKEEASQRIQQAGGEVVKGLTEYATSKTAERHHELAANLLYEWWEGERLSPKLLASPEKAQQRYQALWEKAWNLTLYKPQTTKTKEAKPATLVPTQLKLNAFLQTLQADVPLLLGVKPQDIKDWADEIENTVSDLKVRRFAKALNRARNNLTPAKRNGLEYDMLVEVFNELSVEPVSKPSKSSVLGINFKSPQAMQGMLYAMLELPVRKRSKPTKGSVRDKNKLKGAPATGLKAIGAAFVYDVVEDDDWRAPILKAYKTISLLLQEISLFYDKYPLLEHPVDGRLHPQFRNCGTKTRRPSGTAPNDLQVSKKEGGKIRKCYVGGDYGDGQRVYVAIDFASQELVITACESKCPIMLDAFTSTPRKDLHSLTSTGFANVLLPRMGIPVVEEMSYDWFVQAYRDEEHPLHAPVDEIRGKYGKACIAEGSPVLTDRGLVPIEHVLTTDRVWDGVEWVEHEGVIYQGEREVITYDGVTATPDHIVLTKYGRSVALSQLITEPERPRLALGAIGAVPVVFPLTEENDGPQTTLSYGSLWDGAEALHEEGVGSLGGLRRQGDRDEVHSGGVHQLHPGELPLRELQGAAHQPDRSGRALRTGQHSGRAPVDLGVQPEEFDEGRVQGDASCAGPLVGSAQALPSDLHAVEADGHPAVALGDDARRDLEVSPHGQRRARVYDIVNAGPRHRFTVSGRIVHNCNFLIIYGGSSYTLAENLMIQQDLADRIIDSTFVTYPGLAPWQAGVVEFAKSRGYIETAYGNRRHATPDLWSGDRSLSSRQERQLINSAIQGTAADILKVVRQEIYRRKIHERYRTRANKQVYDEITASVPIEAAVDYACEMAEIMEIVPPGYPVGMTVDIAIGHTWGSVHEAGSTDRSALAELVDKLKTGEISE